MINERLSLLVLENSLHRLVAAHLWTATNGQLQLGIPIYDLQIAAIRSANISCVPAEDKQSSATTDSVVQNSIIEISKN